MRGSREDRNSSCVWYSSVSGSDEPVTPVGEIQDEYWRNNMTNSVLFAEAVRNALASDDQINLGLEIGPHPALKGFVAQNVGDDRSIPLSYSGVLSRGRNDVELFADGLGFVWTQLGSTAVDFQPYARAAAGSKSVQPRLVTGLPLYRWNHVDLGRFVLAQSQTMKFWVVYHLILPQKTCVGRMYSRYQKCHGSLGIRSKDR